MPVPASEIDADDLTRGLEDQPEASRARPGEEACSGAPCWAPRRSCCAREQTGRPDLRQAKRLVQPMVDSIMRHEYSIVGLTALKDHDEYTYAHCVNVSILSISMGQCWGCRARRWPTSASRRCCTTSASWRCRASVLRKPATLSAEEWALMRRHPLEGVQMMTRMPGLSTR